MKNLIFSALLMFFAFGAMAQTASTDNADPAQAATEQMTLLYGLNENQQQEMLKIQERKYRNLAEIEPLKKTDPSGYILKIRSIQLGNNASFERILNAEQLTTLKQQQFKLREKKAVAFKEMKSAGASQQEIDKKMTELDFEAL